MKNDVIVKHHIEKTHNLQWYRKLLQDIDAAKAEIDVARSMFNNVDDYVLLDIAIYAENAARRRYDYLISLAKSNGIRVGYNYIIDKSFKDSEYECM